VISIAEREDLKDKLLLNDFSELSWRQRQVIISEFSRLNNKFNNSKSETIHKEIQENSQLLEEYHDKLDEIKKQWPFDPVNVIASKNQWTEITRTYNYEVSSWGLWLWQSEAY
jgi:uncharacterized circularly permuted ATP-grasp superfamily protein